jgi:hypothetical protein
MNVFKLYESTIASLEPGHPSTKDLRRDQLLDNCDEVTKTLQALIKAKENEIAYRQGLLDMLEKSKEIYDNKLMKANQAYQIAKKHAPNDMDLKISSEKKLENSITTPSISLASTTSTPTTTLINNNVNPTISNSGSQISSSQKSSDLDIPLPSESIESRSSLDRRLSEFLKTFPNLTQAGLAPVSSNNNIKPLPGYYTQQAPPPPPISAAAPPLMAMMRFPPPPLMTPTGPPLTMNPASQENHGTADMDLSDYDESNSNGPASAAGGLIPMVASAMQQGAGGKQHLRTEPQQSFVAGQQYNNPITYTPRLNPLPFDPSIMEPRPRDSSSSSGSRDKHGARSHRNSGSSSGSERPSSSGRSKRR